MQFSARQMNGPQEIRAGGGLTLVALLDDRAGKMSLCRICDGEGFRRPSRYLHVGDLEVLARMRFRG